MTRRGWLHLGLGLAGGCLLAGCGSGGGDGVVTKQEDPNVKARDSMEYYKKNIAGKKKSSRPNL